MIRAMPTSNAVSPLRAVPPPVLILCADEGLTEELVRELAGRHYQPLVDRPGWTWMSLLEWARPVAAVVDTGHPAARSARFLAASDDLEVGLVVFGDPAADASGLRPQDAAATVPGANAQLIGGAVDDAIRRRTRRPSAFPTRG
jgi:hypothetical protein